MNEYLKLVEEAQKKRISLTKEQQSKILNLYKDIAKDLEKSIKKANPKSLSERWLIDYQKQFKKQIKELNKILKKDLEESMLQSAEFAAGIQEDFFNLLDMKNGLKIKQSFSNMFSRIPKEALQELINGDFYKDGKGLSKRLWFNEKKANADFDYIIQKGLAEKKSIYDLANDLAKYVNPDVKKDWDFKKIYPNVGNKKIEYNSFRLAVTSISHAYQLSMKRSCKANPFVEKIEWHTSNSHRETCSLCLSRNGKKYTPDELPMDHPNGVCYFIPIIDKSLDDIGSELHDWINGGSNTKLDSWYEQNKIIKEDNSNNGKSDIIKPRTFNKKIQTVKEKVRVNNGIITEEHLKEAGKIVQDELIENRSEFKVNLDNAQKKYNSFGWDNLLKEKENLAKVNRGFIDPLELGYKTKEEAYSRYQEVQKEIDKLMNDIKLSEARNKLFEAKNDYKGTQEQNILELKKKLSEVRTIGNDDLDIKSHLNNSRSPMVKVITNAYDSYPKDWVEKSISHGNLSPKKVDRGYYSEWDKVIAISGDGGNRSLKTAFHELGHRFERAVPEIKNAEKLFYERRTKGEALQWLGGPYAKSEKSRFDKFLDKYMGKDYGDTAYELVSMGFEYAYTNPTLLWNDEDFATWIYGILTLY